MTKKKQLGRVERVARVIDGDTFRTTHKGRKNSVRLANVNAPEKGKPGAKAATAELKRLIGGKDVTIKTVSRSYRRAVAEVKVGSKSVNAHMRNFLKKKKK